nr:hypothetical protein Iba_chr09dCG15970 [Ipomoea batatas]
MDTVTTLASCGLGAGVPTVLGRKRNSCSGTLPFSTTWISNEPRNLMPEPRQGCCRDCWKGPPDWANIFWDEPQDSIFGSSKSLADSSIHLHSCDIAGSKQIADPTFRRRPFLAAPPAAERDEARVKNSLVGVAHFSWWITTESIKLGVLRHFSRVLTFTDLIIGSNATARKPYALLESSISKKTAARKPKLNRHP